MIQNVLRLFSSITSTLFDYQLLYHWLVFFIFEGENGGELSKIKERRAREKNAELSGELVVFIKDNFGDVNAWVGNQIEASIYKLKN